MSDQHDQHAVVRLLREEVGNLIKTIPGPVESVTLRLGDCTLEVSWAPVQAVSQQAAPVPASAPASTSDEEGGDPDLYPVTAPVVGTFYVAPEPGAPPFVQVGDKVSVGQTVGIVEAMKLMNPVQAERPGEVVEVVAANAESVEYDQALVLIRPEEP